MSDSNTTTCPQCATEQTASEPFCQNCGYRMRSPKTVREPVVSAVSGEGAEADDATSQSASENDPGRSARSSGGRPSRDMVSMSEDGQDDDSDTGGSSTSPGRSSADTSPKTMVEGMAAVPAPDQLGGGGQPGDGPAGAEGESSGSNESTTSRPPTSGLTPIAHQRSKIRWIVAGTVVACVTIVLGLSWLHLERHEDDDSDRVEGEDPEVITIEAGPFREGLSEDLQSNIIEACYQYHESPDRHCSRERLLAGEYPEQTREMPSYGIDSIPVRNTDYDECVEDGDCDPIYYGDCEVWTPQGLQTDARVDQQLRIDNRPAVCVTREEAQTYCEWNDGDLPTHPQWEKAARGENGPLFPWGNVWYPDRANWGERDMMDRTVAGELDGWKWTSPPGIYGDDGASPYGVHDLVGNVAEWIRGEEGEMTGSVRGGSWVSPAWELRTTGRETVDVDARRTDIGFRCVYSE